ncbi:hypothetical protein [Rhizobium sp. BE258]|uniref:hypothetical protein n=1 Tax=Rhizobium sp. BE258 TaxID=2817722 RepID=UPI002856E3B6|nr:hypothetical protein [Rhizobium sp. BE258]MDR7146169.1 hypothetical protein [Rhizobium sp. BE258]
MKTYTVSLPIWLSRVIQYIHPAGRPSSFYREAARSAIKELVFVTEILAVSAAAIAAGILAHSELLKQGGIALVIISLVYVQLFLPLSWPGQKPSWTYFCINVAYQIIKMAVIVGLSIVFPAWVMGLVETALQLSP